MTMLACLQWPVEIDDDVVLLGATCSGAAEMTAQVELRNTGSVTLWTRGSTGRCGDCDVSTRPTFFRRLYELLLAVCRQSSFTDATANIPVLYRLLDCFAVALSCHR